MTELQRFDQNARTKGILIDTNLIVLLVVGFVNRDRIPRFKRTSSYTPADWDLLTGILGQIPLQYTIPHVLSEVSALTDMKGPERDFARCVLRRWILHLQELPVSSREACASPHYQRLGLTDAALGFAAKQQGCSVVTNDSDLYLALSEEGTPVVKFDHLRVLL
jgi:predicted nucleic acid-binding protein